MTIAFSMQCSGWISNALLHFYFANIFNSHIQLEIAKRTIEFQF